MVRESVASQLHGLRLSDSVFELLTTSLDALNEKSGFRSNASDRKFLTRCKVIMLES